MHQLSFFDEDNISWLSIEEVASSINVSTATVRNWIKTGYLQQIGKNKVSLTSFDSFQENVAGSEKLIHRANKSQKDAHDHEAISNSINRLVADENFDSENLGDKYEESLSDAYKNKEGIYYTPYEIAKRFFENLPDDCSTLTFCDPCCGSGNFLLAALEKGFKPENIFGFDIDPIAVKIANRRMNDQTGSKSYNIQCADFLDENIHRNSKIYDVIITNPPWGKKILKMRKEKLVALFDAGSSKDTSALFFFACLEHIKKGGVLGLLLQDAFFNISAFEPARKKALSFEIEELIDFGKPFKGLLTKAKGIVLKKTGYSQFQDKILCQTENNVYTRSQVSFAKNPKSILNFNCTQEEAEVIDHIYSVEHILLANNASFGLGIVTGNNEKHCRVTPEAGCVPAYKGSDIFKTKLGEPSYYISSDFSQYQQVAPMNLYLAQEKLIYRFISSDLVFYYDTNQVFILNSANMLVLNDDFPINTKQLFHLLNSKINNWLFKCLFDTHKVLRADIESLPIHYKYFDTYPEFSEDTYLSFIGIEKEANGTFRIKNQNL